MIIQTGQRTDIPAFYHKWFMNRIKEGYVLVRNPYNPKLVTKYLLNTDVVDCLVFCTKNPRNMLPYIDSLNEYKQFWFVTITPYGKDIEPNIDYKRQVLSDFKILSKMVGIDHISWRYDPILINDVYTVEKHIHYFEIMASMLSGYTNEVIISFVDLYKKVKRNYPELKEVSSKDKLTLIQAFMEIGRKYKIHIKTCGEGKDFDEYGIDSSGCMSKEVIQRVLGNSYVIPNKQSIRPGVCDCFMGNDIGAYNSCLHFCKYCYANDDQSLIIHNYKLHDENSPLLIGHLEEDDIVKDAKQESYLVNTLF